jgi:DNA-binding NarL/FixJ family response regulator
MTIKVFLLDDHEVVRVGLRQLLEEEHDIEVVGEASTASQARARVPALRPDVAVLDVRLPDGDGVTVCRDIRSSMDPPPACLMLTSFSDDEALFDAIMAGAAGYLLKQVSSNDLVGAVRRLATGESMVDPALTDQERRILDLIAAGMTNRQIAQSMFLAEKTVKNYVSGMLRKLGMERRTEAAVFAVERSRKDRALGPPE